MSLRVAKIAGIELQVNVDDEARSSRLWQYVLKPSVYALSRVGSLAAGVVDSLSPNRHEAVEQDAGVPSPEKQALLDRIRGQQWYHSIDLGHQVVTAGAHNHIPILSQYGLPERLDGQRVLDVGTCDGFWAFEFEKRGAAEVVATDIGRFGDMDLNPVERASAGEALNHRSGTGFELAHAILQSKVRREVINVYDLSPERLGTFDLTFAGDLLMHTANPMKALQSVRSVVQGRALFVEPISRFIPRDGLKYIGGVDGHIWWLYSPSALQRMIQDAGFRDVELINTFKAGLRGQRAWIWRGVFRASV